MGGAIALGVLMGLVIFALPFIATTVWSVMWLIDGKGWRLAAKLPVKHFFVYLKVTASYLVVAFVVVPFAPVLLSIVVLAFFAWEVVLFYKAAAGLLSPAAPATPSTTELAVIVPNTKEAGQRLASFWPFLLFVALIAACFLVLQWFPSRA